MTLQELINWHLSFASNYEPKSACLMNDPSARMPQSKAHAALEKSHKEAADLLITMSDVAREKVEKLPLSRDGQPIDATIVWYKGGEYAVVGKDAYGVVYLYCGEGKGLKSVEASDCFSVEAIRWYATNPAIDEAGTIWKCMVGNYFLRCKDETTQTYDDKWVSTDNPFVSDFWKSQGIHPVSAEEAADLLNEEISKFKTDDADNLRLLARWFDSEQEKKRWNTDSFDVQIDLKRIADTITFQTEEAKHGYNEKAASD